MDPSRSQQEWLEKAGRAASAGKPLEMLEALGRSGALDGIVNTLERKWPRLDSQNIYGAVAEAVDDLYKAVAEGTTVTSLGGFLWKAADRNASALFRAQARTVPTDFQAEGAEEALTRAGARPLGVDDDEVVLPEGMDWDEARKWAITAARELLPLLGQRNVQNVMSVVFDAVDKGIHDLSNQEIADATGLSLETVRTSLSRGFARLRERAREVGIAGFLEEVKDIVGGEDE